MKVRVADSPADIAAAKGLVVDFVKALPVDVDFQDIHGELDDFPARFDCVLVGQTNTGDIVGVVALKPLTEVGPGTCEMKRMYVAPAARGTGLGLALCERLFEEAKARGYNRMVLDTLARLEDAVRLYRRTGFRDCVAYYDNPIDDVIYMERAL